MALMAWGLLVPSLYSLALSLLAAAIVVFYVGLIASRVVAAPPSPPAQRGLGLKLVGTLNNVTNPQRVAVNLLIRSARWYSTLLIVSTRMI